MNTPKKKKKKKRPTFQEECETMARVRLDLHMSGMWEMPEYQVEEDLDTVSKSNSLPGFSI